MKLLFDHNLSHRLVQRLADLFPDAAQTRLVGLATASDLVVWEYARVEGFTIVTLDSDFHDLSVIRGHPPKVIWLRCGNSTVKTVERLIRAQAGCIRAFHLDDNASFLELM
jgi:predicted nuclease of predicted toxin-antitoxin system